MAGILTLHRESCLCTADELELFSIPPTDYSIEASDVCVFHPVTAPSSSDVLEFNIPALGPYYLDMRASCLHLQVKIVRKDGTAAVTSLADVHTPDKVIPTQAFATSMFSTLLVYLNQQLVSTYDNYAFRSYIDILMNANEIARQHALSSLLFYPEAPGSSEKLDLPADTAKGLKSRFKCTEGSRLAEMFTPLFTDLAAQNRFLINGVNARLVFRQSSDAFRLLKSNAVPHEHTVQIVKAALHVRRVKILPSVLVGIETRLQKTPASYLLRGTELKTFTVTPNTAELLFDDLYPTILPSKLTIVMVKASSYQGNLEENPFKFQPFSLKRAVLEVDSQQIVDTFDFQHDLYAKSYLTFLQRLNKKDVPFPLAAYERDCFMLHYRLTAKQDDQTLAPISQGNVRLTLQFAKNLSEAICILLLSETPRVLEINKDRQVKFVT